MKNADCFLSSSYVETFGAVLAEAIAYGLPVISTKSEGATEIINKSNGILIKHGAGLTHYKSAAIPQAQHIGCHLTEEV